MYTVYGSMQSTCMYYQVHISLCVGSPADLLKALRSLVEVLVHLEPSIVKTAVTTPQVSTIYPLDLL